MTEDKIGKVVIGIEAAVAQTFLQDSAPGRIILVHGGARITAGEIKRRTEMCLAIFKVLRGDLKWTVERILDFLPTYLRKQLDGAPWEPEARRATWTAP